MHTSVGSDYEYPEAKAGTDPGDDEKEQLQPDLGKWMVNAQEERHTC